MEQGIQVPADMRCSHSSASVMGPAHNSTELHKPSVAFIMATGAKNSTWKLGCYRTPPWPVAKVNQQRTNQMCWTTENLGSMVSCLTKDSFFRSKRSVFRLPEDLQEILSIWVSLPIISWDSDCYHLTISTHTRTYQLQMQGVSSNCATSCSPVLLKYWGNIYIDWTWSCPWSHRHARNDWWS